MQSKLIKKLKLKSARIIHSIAFWPALIAVLFLALCSLMIWFDFSPYGKSLKERLHWLSLKDATTARSILSAITAGVISLTVFSFSMVMIVLNQAAAQLSNRVLDKLIENRFQQLVLGCYIGTIVYALFLLSTIRDINTGIYVPALSTYVVIALTIFDIFLFIYFLHYITQSVKFGTIIKRVQKETFKSLKKHPPVNSELTSDENSLPGFEMRAPSSGAFNGFDRQALLQIAREENLIITFLVRSGDFVMEHTPLFRVNTKAAISKDLLENINTSINISREELIKHNYFYGFRQLTEIAVKALSPGINDPGTAVQSLNALVELLAFQFQHPPGSRIQDKTGTVRIVTRDYSFDDLFRISILPIWDYGKKDRFLQLGMRDSLTQLARYGNRDCVMELLEAVNAEIKNNTIHS